MPSKMEKVRWGVEQRLEFIEFQLFWENGVNRADITERFGLSVPQASKDLSQYQELAPENVWYDKSDKKYRATETFRPIFPEPDSAGYLAQLSRGEGSESAGGANWLMHPPESDQILPLTRNVSAPVLRAISKAVREGQAIEIKYQSMNPNCAKPQWRLVSPHAFGYDGMRWHARAYCFRDEKFKDFLLTRTLDSKTPSDTVSNLREDKYWNDFFEIELVPNPSLTDSQKDIIAAEYGMHDGCVNVTIRMAMLYYFSKRFRFDVAGQLDDARETPIVIRNHDAFQRALVEAMS